MDTGKRQHLQDIYSTDNTGSDDFTPQVSNEVVEERRREMRRHQLTSFTLGLLVLFLAVALIYLVVREYIDITKQSTAPPPITQGFIPRYSLPTESQWVMDFSRNYADPVWHGEGERPFNAAWLKKAAFNIILAEQAAEVGNFKEATEYYENVREILPDLEGIKIPLGMAYLKQEEYEKALSLFESATDTDLPFDILNNLGAACIDAKAYEKGESYLIRSLELKPAYPPALKNMAMLYRKMKQDDKCINAYEQYLDLRPDDTETRHSFALYLTKIGNWELAGEQLRRLTAEIKNEATLYQVLARVEVKLGNDKAAILAFQRASQLTDPSQALNYMNEDEFDTLRQNEDFQALIQYVEQN
ncbi:tetratricopeptide repeat protein [Pontiellaceae bacterium B1224]|nr:tetratricopeptide repeat protein [Pontiellaceae bacterium B1224]